MQEPQQGLEHIAGDGPGLGPGGFVGAAAEGVITTFGVTSSGKSLSGAAYLTRPLP